MPIEFDAVQLATACLPVHPAHLGFHVASGVETADSYPRFLA